MKKSKLKDVEQFLNAFVDEAVRRKVPLITHTMGDITGSHCLMGELNVRSGSSDWMGATETLELRLGAHLNMVVDIIRGWDRPFNGSKLPYERLGSRLRARYMGLLGRKQAEAIA